VFFAHPEVKTHKGVITYFMDKVAGDQDSEDAIQKIVLYQAGKLGNTLAQQPQQDLGSQNTNATGERHVVGEFGGPKNAEETA